MIFNDEQLEWIWKAVRHFRIGKEVVFHEGSTSDDERVKLKQEIVILGKILDDINNEIYSRASK